MKWIAGIFAVLALVYFVLRGVGHLFMFPAGARKFGEVARQRGDVEVYHANGIRFVRKLAPTSPRGPLRVPKAIVFVFHGNAGTADDRLSFADKLCPLGCDVYLPEYPGYGGHFALLNERIIVDNMKKVLDRVLLHDGRTNVAIGAKVPIVFVGRSLGTAVATLVQAETGAADQLVLISPFTQTNDVAKNLVPQFLHSVVPYVVPTNFDAASAAQKVKCQVHVIAASHDVIVPHRISREQANMFSGLRNFTTIGRAGHNDMQNVDPQLFWRAVTAGVLGKASSNS